MTYQEFINKIISERGYHPNYNKKVDGYEIHHIIPKCMGGTNDSQNLVALTIAEHLMAHTLLFRENKNHKGLITALHHMSNEIGIDELLNTVDDKEEFESLIKDICEAKKLYDISGENNPMYNKQHTDEAKYKMSQSKKGKYVGENHPRFGKHHTNEMKENLSKSRKGANNPRARKVYCIELNMVFDTALEALSYVGITNGITQCCSDKYKRETAGRHPITHERLHWVYADKYNI